MQMDIYEKDSYVHSISNLVMLKAFYDANIDITKIGINDYFVDVQGYSIDCSMDILMGGLKLLFNEAKLITYDELESNDTYKEALEGDTPEAAIIVTNTAIKELLSSKYTDTFDPLLKSASRSISYADIDFYVLDKQQEIAILIWFPGALHELAMSLIKVYQETRKLHQTLECEKNGVSDNHNRQIA